MTKKPEAPQPDNSIYTWQYEGPNGTFVVEDKFLPDGSYERTTIYPDGKREKSLHKPLKMESLLPQLTPEQRIDVASQQLEWQHLLEKLSKSVDFSKLLKVIQPLENNPPTKND